MNPGDIDPWWLVILAILPALLATILVFLDQQITAVIVNRKEHKLKVGPKNKFVVSGNTAKNRVGRSDIFSV